MLPPPYEIPTLRTERLELRPWRPEEAPVMMRLAGDREVAATTLSLPHPYPLSAAEEFIGQHAEQARRGSGLVWAMAWPGGEPIGTLGLAFTVEHGRGELGYWLGRQYWSNGYTTEAVRAAVDHAFTTLRLHKVVAFAMTRNTASWRVMEKVGLQKEGDFRGHIQRWGVFEDLVVYAVLADDWSRDGGGPARP